MRILAADDEAIALEQLVEAIREASPGAELISFQKPRELLRYAQENPYDVAFLDIEMGAVSGIEVAKQLKIWNPKVNLIFVTGYDQYMAEAFRLHASGYVCKPATVADIREELEGLRTPVLPEKKNQLVERCFGTFDVFVNGKSLEFQRNKTKELLAYLIDRRGSAVTSGELRAVLWEDNGDDKSKSTYLQMLKKDLVSTLQRAGVADVLILSWNKYAVNPEKISCDFYAYLNDKPAGVRAYNGEYMTQYSWGEMQNVILNQKKK